MELEMEGGRAKVGATQSATILRAAPSRNILCSMDAPEKMRFSTYTRGSTEWTDGGASIVSPDNLAKIRHVLQHDGCIVVEHWHFYGGRAPDRMVFDDFEEFIEYLKQHAVAGDAVDVWSMHELCKADNRLAEGKCPDAEGKIPKGGAY